MKFYLSRLSLIPDFKVLPERPQDGIISFYVYEAIFSGVGVDITIKARLQRDDARIPGLIESFKTQEHFNVSLSEDYAEFTSLS
jgi:hypothetical protein